MSTLVYGNFADPFRDLDRIAGALLRGAESPANHVSYDVVSTGQDSFEVVAAVPGYTQDELTITVDGGVLTVRGEGKSQEGVAFVRRGIPRGKFELRFSLAEHVQVRDAQLQDGLLTVQLVREVPEALKPRTVAINGGAAALPNAA